MYEISASRVLHTHWRIPALVVTFKLFFGVANATSFCYCSIFAKVLASDSTGYNENEAFGFGVVLDAGMLGIAIDKRS